MGRVMPSLEGILNSIRMKSIVMLAAWVVATAALPISRFSNVRDDIPSFGSLTKLSRFSTISPIILKNPSNQNALMDERLLEQSNRIPNIRYSHDSDNDREFGLHTVSRDGSTLKQEGHLVDLYDKEEPVQVTSGSFSFVGDDGKTYTTTFISDDEIIREGILASIMDD